MTNEDTQQVLATNNTASDGPTHDSVRLGSDCDVKVETKHEEDIRVATDINPVYDNDEEEPELHARTYVALASMVVLNFVQVFALQGPPAVLSYIGKDLNNVPAETWVPNSLSLVQAVLAPVISSASDVFQARKTLLVASCVISFIGSCIAPGSQSIYRLIACQVLIGFGFSSVPLAYCVPSEILPRRWRPIAQSAINVAAALSACTGPLAIGALTRDNPQEGWRRFFWIQAGFWGAITIGILIGYRPPKRHTRLDYLSLTQKIRCLDLPGFALLTIGLTLFLTGLNLGSGLLPWTDARLLTTMVIGLVVFISFFIYEWKGTATGILHHELFHRGKSAGRTFALCVGLMFIEGIILFSYMIYYPVLTNSLFTTDPFLTVAREQPFWIACSLSTVLWGLASTRLRTIREPLFGGFLILTGGIVGFATIQPSNSTNALIFSGLSGIGFGAPIILIITGVQLSTPHHLIATATAVTTSARSIAATIFTAIYTAAMSTRTTQQLPKHILQAALAAGLPASSAEAFVQALVAGDMAALSSIPGVTPKVIAAGTTGLKQGLADSIRVVYLIAAPFGAVACIACFFIGDLRKQMNYRVDAPMEDLNSRHDHDHHHHHAAAAAVVELVETGRGEA